MLTQQDIDEIKPRQPRRFGYWLAPAERALILGVGIGIVLGYLLAFLVSL